MAYGLKACSCHPLTLYLPKRICHGIYGHKNDIFWTTYINVCRKWPCTSLLMIGKVVRVNHPVYGFKWFFLMDDYPEQTNIGYHDKISALELYFISRPNAQATFGRPTVSTGVRILTAPHSGESPFLRHTRSKALPGQKALVHTVPFNMFKAVLHPNLKLSCFVCYLKIINTFFQKLMHVGLS